MKTKITKLELLKDTKFLKLYNAQFVNKEGEEGNWSIASRKNEEEIRDNFFGGKEDTIDAVVICAEHVEEEKLVLVRQFRVPLNDYVIELPAGLVDHNEDFQETLARELKEETGLNLVDIDYEKSGMKTYISGGMTDESVALICCTCDGELSAEFLEADEELEAFLVSKEEGRELLKSGEKIDIKAFMALRNFIDR